MTNNSCRLRGYLENALENIKDFKYLSINIKAIQVEFKEVRKFDDDLTTEFQRDDSSYGLPLID